MPNSIPDMLSKDYIRACPHFNSEVEHEPMATMEGFLATLPANEVSVWTALNAVQEYKKLLRAECLDELLAKHDNSAIGLELVNPSNGRLMVVFPEPGYRRGYRLCNYDQNGPICHSLFKTAQEALLDAISDGYRTYAPGALDQLTDLPSWKRGVKFQALIIKTGGNPWPFLDANPDYLEERVA